MDGSEWLVANVVEEAKRKEELTEKLIEKDNPTSTSNEEEAKVLAHARKHRQRQCVCS